MKYLLWEQTEFTWRLKFKITAAALSIPKIFYHYSVFQISMFQSLQYYLVTFPIYSEPAHLIYLVNAFSNKEINCFTDKITIADICLHYKSVWVREELPQDVCVGRIDWNKTRDAHRNLDYIFIYHGNQHKSSTNLHWTASSSRSSIVHLSFICLDESAGFFPCNVLSDWDMPLTN